MTQEKERGEIIKSAFEKGEDLWSYLCLNGSRVCFPQGCIMDTLSRPFMAHKKRLFSSLGKKWPLARSRKSYGERKTLSFKMKWQTGVRLED